MVFGVVGFAVSCVRAHSLRVSRDGEYLLVKNFYSSRQVKVSENSVIRPFYHWAQVNFSCIAIHTPGRELRQIHAIVLPTNAAANRRVAVHAAGVLGLPLRDQEIGTFRQLRRKW